MSGRQHALLAASIMAITIGVFWPVLGHEFITLDDRAYVVENQHIQAGLTWDGVRWAFTTFHGANWHPMTWLSHMLDIQRYGLDPRGHHLSSLLLHAASAALLFLVLSRMTGAVWPSVLAAVIFAIHPLRVESVAWVAERKDVLSAFFGFLTLLAYHWFTQQSGLLRYMLVVAMFAAGLMAKPMLVTVPCLLLLLDIWPLGRWGRVSTARLLAEKLPLFALTAASSIVTLIAQQRLGAMRPMEWLPFGTRVANAVVSCVAYLGKYVWPERLAVFYPHPAGALSAWQVVGAAALLIVVSAAVAMWARRRPYLAVGWLWYLGTLVPVIGLVQVGSQGMADRYTYLPLIGITIAVVWGVAELTSRWRRAAVMVACGVMVIALAIGTRQQMAYWRNSLTLFEQALRVTTNNALAHYNVGVALRARGRLDEAIAHYAEALRIKPNYVEAHVNLGVLLASRGNWDEAVSHYTEALRFQSDSAEAHNNLGIALARQRRLDEAVAHFEVALRIQPEYVEAHNNLGGALIGQERWGEAVAHCREALRLRPGYAKAHVNLGHALAGQGRVDEAIVHLNEALRIAPDSAEAQQGLAAILSRQSKPEEAVVAH